MKHNRSQPDDAIRDESRRREHDAENDSTQTGSFPVIRRRRRIPSIGDSSVGGRLLTSLLIMVLCAMLGFGYAIQLNNETSTYETMSEEELTRLITETSTQIQNLEQRKIELNTQLQSLKAAVDKQKEAEKIAKQNEETNGILSGRLAAKGKGVVITIKQGSKASIDAATMFQLIEELRNAGAEVMAFNSVRIVTSSYVADTDDGLECDGILLTTPYVIRAIGDPQNLQNAVSIAGGVGSRLEVKFGATVKVTSSSSVVIDEIRQSRQFTYAKTVE